MHGAGRQHVAARVGGVGHQELALELAPAPRLVADDQQVDRQRDEHHHEAGRGHVRHVAAPKPAERALHHFDHDEEQEYEDACRGEGLVFAVTVGMIFVGRLARGAHRDDAHDVRGAVGQRVKAVRDNADGAGAIAEHQLGERNRDIQRENAREDLR